MPKIEDIPLEKWVGYDDSHIARVQELYDTFHKKYNVWLSWRFNLNKQKDFKKLNEVYELAMGVNVDER